MYLKYIKQKPKDHNLYPVDVQDYKDISHHFKGICEMYLEFTKKNRKITTCNRLMVKTSGKLSTILEECVKCTSNS